MSFDPRNDPRYAYGEREHALNVPLYLALTLFTCFLFDLYWNYRQMQACNELLGREEFRYWVWFFFCILTFGLYHFYYQYQMGRAIVEIQRRSGAQVSEGLPLLSVAATLIGFGVVTDCIHQLEINRLVD